jgi:hypothetical protein
LALIRQMQTVLGVDFGILALRVTAAGDDANNDWVVLCDNCGEPDPNCVDLTLSNGGWVVSLGRSQYIAGQGWAPVYVAPDWYWRVTRPAEGVSRSIQELRFTFNIPVTNMRIFVAGVNCDFAGPITEIVMNESNFPAVFPFTTGAPNAITVMANHAINQTTQSTLRMIEFCIVPV